MVGCAEQEGTRTTMITPAPMEPQGQPPPMVEQPAMQHLDMLYPPGDPARATLRVEKIMPTQVRVGERFSYTLRITNLSNAPLSNVMLTESVKGIELQPNVAARRGPGQWDLGTLAPGETRTLQGVGVAGSLGTSSSCLAVDYRPTLCSPVAVVNPELQLRKIVPRTAYTCEQPTFTYQVTNSGTGIAHNVVIYERLPEGLTTATGEHEISIEVGDLAAGQMAQRTVAIRPTRQGTFGSPAVAQSDADSATSNAPDMVVAQPSLAVAVTGPEWQYADEPVTYAVTVTNTSNIPARDAQLQLQASAPLSGPGTRTLGTLEPGQSRTMNVTVRGTGQQVRLSAAARSRCAPAANDQIVTNMRRVPALRVEMVDTRDPVRLGEATTYQISVTNQGRGTATGVQVSAIIPDGMTVLSVNRSNEFQMQGNRLALRSLDLGPGRTATWYIQARAEQPGIARFRTEVKADFLDRPVVEIEPTRMIETAPEPM
jgi:uncharacterized repeat protein (TIGR01451 family)